MADIRSMIWIEARKAIRSRMPLWTAIGSLFMPIGIGFLIFVSKNPQIAQKLGLISAKANLLAYAGTDWSSYLSLIGLVLAAGVLNVLTISWTFGREFADGTLKDMLAVPVARASIVLAKFAIVTVWSFGLSVIVLLLGLLLGVAIGLPGGTAQAIADGLRMGLITSVLAILTSLPFAFFASAGRGYLLPIGVAVLTLMATNIVAIVGWGEYFPWAVPGFYAQGKSVLPPVSYGIVVLTGLLGMFATYLWWKYADQNR